MPPIKYGPTSDVYSGLYPALLSASIILLGYFIQYCLFRNQVKKQKELADIQIEEQRKLVLAQIEEQRVLVNKQITEQNITAQATLKLSIQQTLLTLAINKAKDCNDVFDKLENLYRLIDVQYGVIYQTDEKVYTRRKHLYEDLISEMVISKELISNAFKLYGTTENYFTEAEKAKYKYAFWKQLKTDVRGFYCSIAFKMAILKEQAKPGSGAGYGHQLLSVCDFLYSPEMENAPIDDAAILRRLLNV